MDFEVPLNRLKFGQEDGAGINARVTGRQDGIPELAANIHARGQIENLVVKACGEEFYSVSNGNRRLAAFRMIHGEQSSQPIRCTLRDVDEDGAFEDSLTTAVTAKQLHPVDQYEAFARLRDRGKTVEEIGRQYGMTDREVEQALALGHLSPKIRQAWRAGEIKAQAAKAFTLAADHAAQDKLLDDIRDDAQTGRGPDLSDVDGGDIKEMLKIGHDNSGALVEFVGIDAYVKRGGKVTRDLFGTDHQVSDPKLAKTMAAEKLKTECEKLVAAGWSFAVTTESVRNTQHSYGRLKVDDAKPSEVEEKTLAELNAMFNGAHHRQGYYDADSFFELTGPQQNAYLDYHALKDEIERRRFPAKLMAKAGCFVGLDDDGFLDIEYGRVKPAKREEAERETNTVKRAQAKSAATAAVAAGRPAPEPTTLSNALKLRLEAQLIAATRDAIAGEPQLVNSPLFEVLARTICAQIIPDRPFHMPDQVRTKLPTIRQSLNADVFNAAIAKRFDAEDYFSSAPKSFIVKAIAEAINPDEARKASTGKTKVEIWKFALANLGKTGWLPKELRTAHYVGPGSEGYQKAPAASPITQMAHKPKPPAKAAPVKRAAAAKKAVKKTLAKKKTS